MKRLRVILLFLFLGAIVNVAVAWGCAIILAEQTDNWTIMRVGVSRIENGYVWFAWRLGRPGYFKIESIVWEGPIEAWDERWEESSAVIEPWSRIPGPQDLRGRKIEWQESASGWPCASMWSRHNVLDPLHDFNLPGGNPRVLPRDKLDKTWLIDWSFLPRQLLLPTGLLWPGLVFNTLFYAMLLWLVIPGPFALRRFIRHKRGLCLKCAYDLRGAEHEACPECGHTC